MSVHCTVRFWKSRSSNNDHMARCRGCSMVVPLAYGLHVYAEEPRLSRLHMKKTTHTHTHTHTHTGHFALPCRPTSSAKNQLLSIMPEVSSSAVHYVTISYTRCRLSYTVVRQRLATVCDRLRSVTILLRFHVIILPTAALAQ